MVVMLRIWTGTLGAVFRTVLETMRTLFVWLVRVLDTMCQFPSMYCRKSFHSS